jgi:uncharacterized membrane protein
MGTGRLEAFSDGVLAVAITLLVLDLHVDSDSAQSLVAQLVHEWPSFVGYALSFLVLGIIWVNHHALLAFTERVDRALLFYNLLLLLWATTIPFTTAALAGYTRTGGQDGHLAVLLYGVSLEGMALSFTAMLRHILRHQLAARPVSDIEARRQLVRFGAGVLVYPAVTIVGLFSLPAMLGCYVLVNGFYALEQTPAITEPVHRPFRGAGRCPSKPAGPGSSPPGTCGPDR